MKQNDVKWSLCLPAARGYNGITKDLLAQDNLSHSNYKLYRKESFKPILKRSIMVLPTSEGI